MKKGRMSTQEGKAYVRNGIARGIFALFAMVLEASFVVLVVTYFNNQAEWISYFIRLLAVLLVLGIYSQYKTPAMKMPWVILILVFPILGVTMYLLVGFNRTPQKMRKRYSDIDKILLPLLPANRKETRDLARRNRDMANISRYLKKYAGYPVYEHSAVTYFDDTVKGLEAQKEDLRRAKHFIFMEYHAIEDAESWHGIQAILAEKAREGVEVRLFYDDLGSIPFITGDFVRRMKDLGIRCRAFNPVGPFLNFFLNNRDHRKITVVDGRVAYTGGYNLANEYFHVTQPYGFWKDTGIRVEGEAVRSFTVMFLEMWNAVKENDINDDSFDKYLPPLEIEKDIASSEIKDDRLRAEEEGRVTAGEAVEMTEGFVIPYADNPMDDEQVGENVYMSIIQSAKKYCWFMTPYLIISDEMNSTLSLAAKRGVDVRIITPGIPDKKLVYRVTRSYYHGLTRNGVKIYEFRPGFCHAKVCVSDDRVATCGTINLDFRSFYHHFEDGCVIYDNPAVGEIKKDFEETFPKCENVTEFYNTGRGRALRFGQLFLRLFAPLM